jgi:integrase
MNPCHVLGKFGWERALHKMCCCYPEVARAITLYFRRNLHLWVHTNPKITHRLRIVGHAAPAAYQRFPLLPHHRAPQPAERGALCDLRRDQVELNAAVLHVRRVKNGTPSTHPLLGDELRALRRLQRESTPSPFVFVRERGSPFTTAGFARMLERAAASAGLELKAHPHMLRHACGYALANKGHDTRATQGWLGHRSITSTAIYTALAPNRFKDFWRD